MRLSAEEIVKIRKATGYSQTVFAKVYRIPYATLTFWEQGHRSPTGTSVVYLRLIRANPEEMAKKVERLDRKKITRRKFKEAA